MNIMVPEALNIRLRKVFDTPVFIKTYVMNKSKLLYEIMVGA